MVSAASLLAAGAVMTVTALVARRIGKVAVVDTAWGLGFVVVALVCVVLGDGPVRDDLERRTRLVQRAATPDGETLPLRSAHLAQVRSVHVSRPSAQVAEVSVHVRHGQRSRALALRLDLQEDRWVCTALEFS